MHYLDNAATTPVDPEVLCTVTETLKNYYGNPSSLHRLGMQSEDVIAEARGTIAQSLGCAEKELYFTACGTESNNIAIIGAALARKGWADNVVCTGYEHPSVEMPMRFLENFGFTLKIVKPDKNGVVSLEDILNAIDSKTAVAAVMQVNNEIGTITDVAEAARRIKEKNNRTAVHVDGVQGFMKIPFGVNGTKIDSYSLSGHKIYAPKGIGALYLRSGHNIKPPFTGGGQEKGVRSGTENIGYIAGMAKAVSLAKDDIQKRFDNAKELRDYMKAELSSLNDVVINSPENASPYNFNFSVLGVRSETLLHYLERYDVYVSSGSACSKGLGSHTLTAMGLSRERIDGSVRVSMGKYTTREDIDALLEGVSSGMASLAKNKRR